MPQKCYRLLESERAYLNEGRAPGSYRQHELRDRVEEKVDLLPIRFERLFKDVELLSQHSTKQATPLATDHGFYAWLELLNLNEDASRQEAKEALIFEAGEPGSAPADFGAKLGKTVDRLSRRLELSVTNEVDIVADLVWGFLRGLQFDRRSAREITEVRIRNDVEEILQRVDQRGSTFADTLETDFVPEFLEREKVRNQKFGEMSSHVRDHLQRRSKSGRGSAPDNWGQTEETTDEGNGFCREVVNHLIDDALDGEGRVGTGEQRRSFWDQHGPAEEFDPTKFVTETRIQSVIEARRLDEIHELERELIEDTEDLDDHGWRGVSVIDVLPTVVKDGPLSSKEIATQIIGSRDHTASVTRLAKNLAGDVSDSPPDVEIWTGRPLLAGDRSGWKATAYGEAAAHALERHLDQEKHQPYPSTFDFRPFPYDLLRRALSELTDSSDD